MVVVILLTVLLVVFIFLDLYHIEKKNTLIIRQEYEIKEKNHDIVKKDLQLKEVSEAYELLYREFERYKQLNPDSGQPRPTTPYDLVNNILGGSNEME